MSADSFTLAHLSDPHLSSLSFVQPGDLIGKRLLGYLSWRLHRRLEHRGEVLTALDRDLAGLHRDHTVVTGDLTHIGLPGECHEAQAWLHGLGPPSRVTVVPGNHDAYAHASWERTMGLWAEYMGVSRKRDRGQQDFPSVRSRGSLALIGLSTARPSLPFLAVGSLGRQQLERLAPILREAGRNGRFRVVLLHHPVLPDVVNRRQGLTDAQALREVLAREGAELVLHGHAHRSFRGHTPGPAGPIPVLAVPSASAMGLKKGELARYHLYRITPDPGGWRVDVSMREYDRISGHFSEVGEMLQLRLPWPGA